ncbi:hypothetical protein ACHAWF_004092 [Thalassiosira exigua]
MSGARLTPPAAAASAPPEVPNSLESMVRGDDRPMPPQSNHVETKRKPKGINSRPTYQMTRVRMAPHAHTRASESNSSSNANAAKRWVMNTGPLSPGKRRRQLDYPLGLPSLASPPNTSSQRRHPQSQTKTKARKLQVTESPSEGNNSSDSDSFLRNAQKTALQCVDHASRRQAAAKAALAATSEISSSLKDLVGDSNRALTVARKSRIEAENAAVRAEGAAKKVKEASDLVAQDKQRASVELDEANAQAEEAWEFLRRVGGTSKGDKNDGMNLKTKQDSGVSARIGTVVEVSEERHESKSSRVANTQYRARAKSPKGGYQGEKNGLENLSQSRTKIPFQPAGSDRDSFIEPIRKYKGHTSPVTQIAALDHKLFISSSWDTTIRMWNADTGECISTFRGHRDWVHAVCVLDSKHFISGSDDRTIKMWNVDKEECVFTFKGHSSFVKALAPMDGDRFLSGSRDRTIKLFSAASRECLHTFEGHMDVVSSIVPLDPNHFASGSHDSNIKYWCVSPPSCVRTLVGHTGSIKSLAVVSTKQIVSGSDDKMIRLWDVSTGKCLRDFGSKNSLVFSVTYICEGFFLACGGNNIKLYHIPTGTCVKSYETPRISLAVVRLDDERFITGSDQMLHLWKF